MLLRYAFGQLLLHPLGVPGECQVVCEVHEERQHPTPYAQPENGIGYPDRRNHYSVNQACQDRADGVGHPSYGKADGAYFRQQGRGNNHACYAVHEFDAESCEEGDQHVHGKRAERDAKDEITQRHEHRQNNVAGN